MLGHRILNLVLILEVGLCDVLVFAYQYLIARVGLTESLGSVRLISVLLHRDSRVQQVLLITPSSLDGYIHIHVSTRELLSIATCSRPALRSMKWR